MQMAKQNDNVPHTPAIRHLNWKKNFISIDIWHVEDELRSLMPFVWRSDRSKSGFKIVAWNGKRNIKWHPWILCHIIWDRMVIPIINSTFIHHNLHIWVHRTRGTFRVLVRDSINCIKSRIKRRQQQVQLAIIRHRTRKI